MARELDHLRALHAITRAVASGTDARPAIVAQLAEFMDAPRALLAEPDHGIWTVTYSIQPEIVGQILSPRLVAELGIVDDPALGPVLARAVQVRTDIAGVLVAGWSTVPEHPPVRLMEQLTEEASLALRMLADRHEVKERALTDPLTGLANRRAFERELGVAVARARRSRTPLALLTMGLNQFRVLNDIEGREAGDQVLIDATRAWSETLRAGDVLARLGGDEFAAILVDCEPDYVEEVAERIRQATPHRNGSGVGVAQWSGEHPELLQLRSERALFADKASQRTSLVDDTGRLSAVMRTGLWGAMRSEALDAIARRAHDQLDLPVYVTLVGSERVHYAGKASDTDIETGRPISHALCQHAVMTAEPVVVPDARQDPVLSEHLGVREGLVAYAGIPLTSLDGHVLGTVCAVDRSARYWSRDELRCLQEAADEAVSQLDALASLEN